MDGERGVFRVGESNATTAFWHARGRGQRKGKAYLRGRVGTPQDRCRKRNVLLRSSRSIKIMEKAFHEGRKFPAEKKKEEGAGTEAKEGDVVNG